MVETVTNVLFPMLLAFIMLTLGLGTTLRDFAIAILHPKALLVGVFAQMLLLPAVTYAIVTAANLDGQWAFGVMILSVCPGGATTNMFTRMAAGNVALSITLTAVVMVISVFTLPLWVALWASMYLSTELPEIAVGGLMATLIAITIVPAMLGALWRHKFPTNAARLEPGLSRLGQILFWFILFMGAVAGWDGVKLGFVKLGPLLIGLAVLLTVIGWAAAFAFRLPPRDQVTLAIETGIQNGTVGVTILSFVFVIEGNKVPDALVPIGLYGLLVYGVLIPVVYIRRRMIASGKDPAV